MNEAELKVTASLAQLELKDGELARLEQAVKQMLEYFAKMEEIDVSDLQPTTHALIQDNPLREDVVKTSAHSDQLLDNAPECDNGFFVIPNIL